VSLGADYILADPNVITGNIGARATFVNMKGLLDKLGVNVTTVKSGTHKDMGDPLRGLDEEERSMVQEMIDEVYDEFRSLILESRGDRVAMNEIDDGRLLTGRQAYRYGLVDQLGYKEDAIKKAAELAGMKGAPSVCNIEVRKDSKFTRFFAMLSEGVGRGISQALGNNERLKMSYS